MTKDAADDPRSCTCTTFGAYGPDCGYRPHQPIEAAATSFVPSVGDRVRIVLEGEVTSAYPDAAFVVGDHRTPNTIVPSAAHVVSVEKLEAPQPEWLAGDVVTCQHTSQTYTRSSKGEWIDREGRDRSFILLPPCVLTLLVRGGETVAAEKP